MTQPPVDPPPNDERPSAPVPPSAPPPPPAPPGPAWPQQPPPPAQPQGGYPAAWQPAPWPQAGATYEQPVKPGTNGFAIAALVFGILPVCFIGVVFAIVALVQTSKSGQKGKGFAITGLVLSGVWLVGLVTVGVIASQDQADRDASGQVTKEGRVFAEDLKVGDCFNGLNDVQVGDNIGSVRAVPCSKLHEAEAFAQVHLEGSDYPGAKTLQAQDQGRPCIDKLKAVAPKAFEKRSVGVIWIYPQKLSWRMGNHHLTCVAIGVGRSTGSVTD